MHPPFSLDLKSSDYYAFLVFQNFHSVKKMASRQDCKSVLLEFSAFWDKEFL